MDNNTEILERVIARLPYVQQIKNIDLSHAGEARFEWRGTTYKVRSSLGVEEVGNGLLVTSDACLLMAALLKTVPR